MYRHFIKRMIDVFISSIGIAVLAFPMGIMALIIAIEDPGRVLFTQRRVGRNIKNKNGTVELSYFTLYKFRSMKLSTPHDVPTHLLNNPDQYLLKCGKIMRRYSLDELPQLINILRGDMSIIGPRPALWNQFDLIKEREKYGANDIRPGLSGWAQINGRDELDISTKAKLDGEYVMNESFVFDCKCFFGTFLKVIKSEGVVEGGTGVTNKREE